MIGAGLCIFLMTTLPVENWVRFGVWMVAGLPVYAAYGYRHSRLRCAGDGPQAGPPTLSDGGPGGAG